MGTTHHCCTLQAQFSCSLLFCVYTKDCEYIHMAFIAALCSMKYLSVVVQFAFLQCTGFSSPGYEHKYVTDGGFYMCQLLTQTLLGCVFLEKEGEKMNHEHAACFLLLMLHPPHRGVKMTARNIQLLLIPPHSLDKNAYC